MDIEDDKNEESYTSVLQETFKGIKVHEENVIQFTKSRLGISERFFRKLFH